MVIQAFISLSLIWNVAFLLTCKEMGLRYQSQISMTTKTTTSNSKLLLEEMLLP